MQPVRFEQEANLRVSREALWALIADTERLNRETGLPPVSFSFLPRDSGGSFVRGETRILGLNLRYREEPYQWVRPEGFSVRRIFENGPLRDILLDLRLEMNGDAETVVRSCFAVTPRTRALRPVAQMVAKAGAGGLLSACRTFETFLLHQAATPYPKHHGRPPAHQERLRQAVERLCDLGGDRQIAEQIAVYLMDAPVEDVTNLRPFALADRWGADRMTLLRTCLHGVSAQLLELRWRILCPACRASGDGMGSLGDMTRGEAHCPSCNLTFGPEFDRSVEVCFSVAPLIRSAAHGETTFCVGGPGRSPHVVAQWPLAPGAESDAPLDLTPGRYLLASPQAERVEIAVAACGGEALVCLRPRDGRAAFALPLGARLPAAGVWRLRNATDLPVVLRLETPGWLADVATAAVVTSLQEFRDRFASQVLSPGVELAVRQICIVFSDLRGSTHLYRTRGDAPSYSIVRDHFTFLREIFGRYNGGVVKTIGDAIMAAFADPADAMAAALEVQRLAPRRADPLIIKLGLHAGPALAVNANGFLDYFGQSVNLAARIQAESRGGDVVVAAALAKDASVAPLIEGVRREPFRAALRGTGETLDLLRLWV